MKKINFLLFVMVFISFSSFAGDNSLTAEIIKSNTIKLNEHGKIKNYRLSHKIEGYKINCLQNRLFAWGTPLRFKNDSPQAQMWTLIDVQKRKVITTKSEGFGIYEISFAQDGMVALVDYARGTYLVDIKNGQITIKGVDNFIAEICQ